MMIACFYVVLPGRITSTNLCTFVLIMTFIFWQDPALTFGIKVHRYMVFMLISITILLLTFKAKLDRWARVEFLSRQELDTINSTKDKILATIAHDIRNPLAIIMAKAERCANWLTGAPFIEIRGWASGSRRKFGSTQSDKWPVTQCSQVPQNALRQEFWSKNLFPNRAQ